MKADLISSMGDDLTVVNAARVSYNKEAVPLGYTETNGVRVPTLHYSDEKLIKYLAKHKHFSPFGHCFASFRIICPIFVTRQCLKHSYLRVNEQSRRYIKTTPGIFAPDVWRSSTKDKKQGSGDPLVQYSQEAATTAYELCVSDAVKTYDQLLDLGVCEEQARACLPLSSLTEFIWSGSLDAFAKMAVLRCAPDTQAETREIANQISNVMGKLYPHSWGALTGTDWKSAYEGAANV